MNDNLDELEAFASGLISNLSTTARREITRDIARKLRKSQATRIADQLNPDGSDFAPRKPQKRTQQGRIKRKMFNKIRLTKYLKASWSPNSAVVEFTKNVQRIARVHQFGLRDRVSRIRDKKVQYEQRELLGFTEQDKLQITELVIKHLAK